MIIDLELDRCSSNPNAVFHYAESLGLDKKGCHEVSEGWDIIQTWRDRIEAEFGILRSIRHRSDQDDPPDFDLLFENHTVNFEHTRLQPSPLGWAQAIKKSELSDVFTAVPPLSKKRPRDRKELIHTMTTTVRPPFPDVYDEYDEIIKTLVNSISKKMASLPDGAIIGVTDRTSWVEQDCKLVFQIAEQFINQSIIDNAQRYWLIILCCETEPRRSALVIRDRPIEYRCA